MFLIDDHLHSNVQSSFSQRADKAIDPVIIEHACQQACQHIAPVWPLDQSIAVNPHWKRIHMPLRTVAARMAVLAGIQVFPTREYQLNAWRQKRITHDDLQHALLQCGMHDEVENYVNALLRPQRVNPLPLLIDVLDDDAQRFQRLSWRDAITHQVSQTCAAYFDREQSGWQPNHGNGLYTFWRDTLVHDHGIGTLMGLPNIHAYLDYLPVTREQAERWAVEMLGLDAAILADYFEAVLLTVNGWASWCAYLDWQAKLSGTSDDCLRDLLAIRLAWGVILMQCKGLSAAHGAIRVVQQKWRTVAEQIKVAEETMRVDEVWQHALEIGYQRSLAQQFYQLPSSSKPDMQAPALQAAFCIDVRSEPMRRALETVSSNVQTLGVAGFFGLPVAYQPLASHLQRPQLPGLLAPTQLLVDRVLVPAQSQSEKWVDMTAQAGRQRRRNMMLAEQMERLTQYPGAAFSLVESAGPLFLKPLLTMVKPRPQKREGIEYTGVPSKYKTVTRPTLQHLTAEEKADICAGILHSMGLTSLFAPLVLLVGHVSQSSNNAHAASLDCGACCGQSGEANTRALALMLNDSEVRRALKQHGIELPMQTRFVAALHNTTTQEIQGFDLDLLDADSQLHWHTVQPWLQQAGHQVRLQLQTQHTSMASEQPQEVSALFKAFHLRANDAAQTRPEWGLANNAAFIMAPRVRTQQLNLAGRAFLHEYNAEQDLDGSLLEQLMTAPMLVTHWINWQYHASTCAPERLGSGNKLLHNVVGGHIGVFEGNGGDLRIGLSRQSLHNGKQWMHEPLRLTVIVVASRARIQPIIEKHAVVKQLIQNGWLHLWCEEQETLWQYTQQHMHSNMQQYWQPLLF